MSGQPPHYGQPARLDLDGGATVDVGGERYAPDRVLVRLALDGGATFAVAVLTEDETRRLARELLRVLDS
jgi:hypothetical protein